MSRTLRPLAALAMVALIGLICAGCGFERILTRPAPPAALAPPAATGHSQPR